MTDTLLTYAQAIAGLPNNTANLISPQDVRNAVLSVGSDAGEVGDDSLWVLPCPLNVPQNINNLSPAPNAEIARGWVLDGNSALIPEWGATVLPAGLLRGASVTSIVAAAPTTNVDLQIRMDLRLGAAIAGTRTVTLEGGNDAADQLIASNNLDPYEPFLGEPWSIELTNLTNSDSLDIAGWDLKIVGIHI